AEAGDGGLLVKGSFAAELFEPATIGGLLEQLENLLRRGTENPAERLSVLAESLPLRPVKSGPLPAQELVPADIGDCPPSDSETVPRPLSFPKKRSWLLHRLEPDQPVYNQLAAIRLDGPLNVVALQEIVNQIVRRHEILRTVFPESGAGPMQRVCSPTPFQL